MYLRKSYVFMNFELILFAQYVKQITKGNVSNYKGNVSNYKGNIDKYGARMQSRDFGDQIAEISKIHH